MNSLKRFFISMKSQIDSVANEFENHEALASVAIKDLQNLGAKIHVQLQQTKTHIKKNNQRLHDLQLEAERWSDRAVKTRSKDEQKALECVKRLRSTKQQIKQMESQIAADEKLEIRLQSDINKIQSELAAWQNKKQLLSARQQHAQMNATTDENPTSPLQEVDEIFQRWEQNVTAEEFRYPDAMADDFAAVFEQQEDEIELQMLLDELTNEKNSNNTPDSGAKS